MKALELLKADRDYCLSINNDKSIIQKYDEAIKELEHILEEKDLLEEYVQFARLHIETYRCSCGSLGKVGYRCSNKECNKYQETRIKIYETINLPNGYNFKQTNNQLIYEHFDGTNISTISKWKVGLNCNIENIRRLISLMELKQINSELIDYIDGLEYKDSIN